MEGTLRLLKAGPCFLGLGIRSVLRSESMCDYIDNLLWWLFLMASQLRHVLYLCTMVIGHHILFCKFKVNALSKPTSSWIFFFFK